MSNASRATLAHGREALHSFRIRAEHLAEQGLATTSTIAERAGNRATEAISRGSDEVAKMAKRYSPSLKSGLSSVPALGVALRFARRHPAALLAAGAAIAALSLIAWRMQDDDDSAADEINQSAD